VIAIDTMELIPTAPFKMADQHHASVMCLYKR